MKHTNTLFALFMSTSLLSACASTAEPETEIAIVPQVVDTCLPIATLEKIVVPAVIKRGFSIVSIESPPEYYTDPKTGKTVTIQTPPIETKTPYSKVVTPEEIYYKTAKGERVTDICELNAKKPEPMPAPVPASE